MCERGAIIEVSARHGVSFSLQMILEITVPLNFNQYLCPLSVAKAAGIMSTKSMDEMSEGTLESQDPLLSPRQGSFDEKAVCYHPEERRKGKRFLILNIVLFIFSSSVIFYEMASYLIASRTTSRVLRQAVTYCL